MKSTKIILLASILFSSATFAKDGDPDIAPAVRLKVAEKQLANKPNFVAVYVKGLVCSSCSIGVKVHLRKLKGVDKKLLDKGITLDINSQLATVALKPGAMLNPKEVVKAIDKAGYEAGAMFVSNGNKVVRTPIQ